VVPEVSFAVYGERGVIDILAFHAAHRKLLVIELKTQLVDVQELLSAVDRYRRLAPRVAAERGWAAREAAIWVVLRDTTTNRRRVAAHVTVLRSALPHDGRTVRGWLRAPHGRLAALSFLSDLHPGPLDRVLPVVSASASPTHARLGVRIPLASPSNPPSGPGVPI
jgi:hypothetical protein